MTFARTSSQPVRKLGKLGDMTYIVTLPKDYVQNLKWQKGQNLRVTQAGNRIIIEDWEKN